MGGVITFELFEFLETETQKEIIQYFSNSEVKTLLEEIPDDERTSFLKSLEPEIRDRFLSFLTQEEREEAKDLLSYQDQTAASIMTKEYAFVKENLTLEETLNEIRKQAPNKETIYYTYVIDNNEQLLGFISLEKLILSDPKLKINKIMKKDFIYVKQNEDIEEAANIIKKYDLFAVPVVDEEMKLLGIITHDDATDIIIKEDTEDIEKFMGFTGEPTEESYLLKPTIQHVKRRFTWTLIPLIMQIFSGFIISTYLHEFKDFAILALYMTMIAATGGNTGSQSATLVIRALTLKEIFARDFLKVISKEFKTALLMGLSLGVAIIGIILLKNYFFPAVFLNMSLMQLIICVSLAVTIQVITSSLIGSSLPIIATKLKIDPAVMSSPILASAVDISGLLIYFNIAQLIIG